MRVAVIGAGISGLGAAYALDGTHDVTLFEAQTRLGGHANTATISYDGAEIAVDTGFIVYNSHNYPNLVALFAHLGVETQASDMSFSVSDVSGFEWSSNGLAGLLAWKRNALRPGFLGMLGDVVRFSRQARADLAAGACRDASLGAYVRGLGLGQRFLDNYLLPMGAAIWSTPEAEMLDYPAESFLRFFDNHRLLHLSRPSWRTVTGGSRAYVAKLAARLGARARIGEGAEAVIRDEAGVVVRTLAGAEHRFDHAILACHSDEALRLIERPLPAEREALKAIRYAPNVAYLHRDPRLMPKRRAAWAAWNAIRTGEASRPTCVSYWMNALQGIDPAKPLFVTLNPPIEPRPELAFARYEYAHPQFDAAAFRAQATIEALQGADRLSFAGAWLGYGFHEDGLASGLRAAERLEATAPWLASAPAAALEAAA